MYFDLFSLLHIQQIIKKIVFFTMMLVKYLNLYPLKYIVLREIKIATYNIIVNYFYFFAAFMYAHTAYSGRPAPVEP